MPTVISEQVKILAELQKIDSQVYEIKSELATHPELHKKAEHDFDKKKISLKAAEDESKALQVKHKSLELDLGTKEEKVKKLQSQLFSLKSNKEYQAMEFEIKAAKADNSLLEEEILKSYDLIEAAKAKVAKEKDLLAAEEKIFKAAVDEIKKASAELEKALAAEEEKRKVFLPNIDPKILTQYERLLKSSAGLAIVPVWNNACGGCHVGLPPQLINEVRMGEKLLTCESCARILYWHE